MEEDLFGVCPYVTTQKLLQGKWSILIMHHLSEGPVRFNELLRRMPQMTHTTLATQLRQLETQGLIIRKEYPQIPPKVEYRLSEIGTKWQTVLDSIASWGLEYIDSLKNKE